MPAETAKQVVESAFGDDKTMSWVITCGGADQSQCAINAKHCFGGCPLADNPKDEAYVKENILGNCENYPYVHNVTFEGNPFTQVCKPPAPPPPPPSPSSPKYCVTSKDCPEESYCMNDPTKTSPYLCHA